MLRIVERSNVSHDGRDNHGYSNYDEIWTWIPIIRGNGDACPGRDSGNTRVFTTTASNSLPENLEPPPYSVAISTPPSQVSLTYTQPQRNQSNSSGPRSQPSLPPVSTNLQSNVPNQNSSNNPRISRNIENRESNAHTVTVTSGGHSVVNDMVSNALINNRNQSDERREISPRQDSSTGVSRQFLPNVQSPHVTRSSQMPSGRHDDAIFIRETNPRRPVRVHSPYRSDNRAIRPFTYDANEGMYSFVTGENGRRAWCDIPPSLLDEDGPPPYTPAPDYPGRSRGNRTRYNANSSPYLHSGRRSTSYPVRSRDDRQTTRAPDNRAIPDRERQSPLRRAPIVRYTCEHDSSFWFSLFCCVCILSFLSFRSVLYFH